MSDSCESAIYFFILLFHCAKEKHFRFQGMYSYEDENANRTTHDNVDLKSKFIFTIFYQTSRSNRENRDFLGNFLETFCKVYSVLQASSKKRLRVSSPSLLF